MDAETARKYLAGEVSLFENSQSSEENTATTTPAETAPSSSDENNSEDQTSSTTPPEGDENGSGSSSETPAESKDSKPAGTATQTAQDDKGSDGKPGFLEGKKDKRLPYPNAKETDLEKLKANQAFIRQKDKFKKRVAQLENEKNQLKALLMKYSSVDPNSLKDKPEELMDLKLAKNNVQTRLKALQDQQSAVEAEQEEIETENANRIYQERVNACFTDDAEKNHYNTLMANGRDKFVQFLNQYDPENAILQYLDDCEISPLMVRTLMTNPTVLRGIVEKRNPISKAMELKSLENRIRIDMKLRQTSGAKQPTAKKLPSTGSQTQPGSGSPQNQVRDSNYWRNYLNTHNI